MTSQPSSLPSFQTARLHLRPRVMADFEACLAMDRDPDVIKFIQTPWRGDPARHEAFLRERIAFSLGDGLGYWSIFAKDCPAPFLGWILLIPCDGIGPEIEIGWRLNRAAWGKGYASEAARPVLTHAMMTVGAACVVADIDPNNLASLRVAEKIGMAYVGEGEHNGVACKSYRLTAAQFAEGYAGGGSRSA